MIDWITIFSLGLIPVSALLVAAGVSWLNRDLMKPQEPHDQRTPAE